VYACSCFCAVAPWPSSARCGFSSCPDGTPDSPQSGR
jgi:hypothetical protein